MGLKMGTRIRIDYGVCRLRMRLRLMGNQNAYYYDGLLKLFEVLLATRRLHLVLILPKQALALLIRALA